MTDTSHSDTRDVDVVIVGGGPVGLSSAVLMERFGLKYVLIEKSETTTTHPKARGTWPRTMELFRQWGVEDAVRRRGIADDADVFAFVESVTGHEFGRTRPEEDIGQTPAWKCICSQDVVEEELFRLTTTFVGGEILFSTEFVELSDDGDGVVVTARSTSTGDVTRWRAKYVIAADGAGSPVRRQLDISMNGPSQLATVANDYWQGDLSHVPRSSSVAGYRVMSTIGDVPSASILNTNGRDKWLTLMGIPDADPDARVAPWSDETVVDHARHYTGIADLDVSVINRSVWRMSRQVAQTFKKGRVFLVGDAAHRFPPNGGFGMNSGIQDAHNLAWKLAFVLSGRAEPALLDTYDTERRPVAESNADFSFGNFMRFIETDHAFAARNPDQIRFWIKDTENHLHSAGQGLGFSYDDGALVPDGTIKVAHRPRFYEPSDRPGGRFPHLWLDLAYTRSTIDWFDRDFVLVVGPNADDWKEAAPQASKTCGVNIEVRQLERADERDGIHMGLNGAVLVRPDGHVAFRMPWTPSDPTTELVDTLATVLRLSNH